MTAQNLSKVKKLTAEITIDIKNIEFLNGDFQIVLSSETSLLRIKSDSPASKKFAEALIEQSYINIENRLSELKELEALVNSTK